MKKKSPALILVTLFLVLALAPPGQAATIAVIVDSPASGHQPFFLKSNAAPLIKDDRTMIPLRAVSESLGFKVEWQQSNNVITISKNNRQLNLQIGSTTATVDGTTVEMGVKPLLVGNLTYVPLRFISENLGYNVYYSQAGANQQVAAHIYITSYSVLPDQEISRAFSDSNHYYQVPARNDQNAFMALKESGTTQAGLRIGDSVDKVIQLYGIPAEPVRRSDYYTDKFSGTITYLGTFVPRGQECYGPLMEVACQNGSVKTVHFIPAP